MTVAGTIHAIPIARHPASVAKVNRAPLVERAIFLAVLGSMVLALRIRDEENMLTEELDGYLEYTEKVRYRLVPGVW